MLTDAGQSRPHTTPMARRKALRAILNGEPGNSAQAQRNRIFAALDSIGPCTTAEMVRWLDCPRPGARLSELRAQGFRILTHWRTDHTEAGEPHRFALYALAPTHPPSGKQRTAHHHQEAPHV